MMFEAGFRRAHEACRRERAREQNPKTHLFSPWVISFRQHRFGIRVALM